MKSFNIFGDLSASTCTVVDPKNLNLMDIRALEKARDMLVAGAIKQLHLVPDLHLAAEMRRREISTHSASVTADPRVAELEAALKLARKRIEYLGLIAGDRHMDSNDNTFLPHIDAALAARARTRHE